MKASVIVKIPAGWRRLKVGEKLMAGDRFLTRPWEMKWPSLINTTMWVSVGSWRDPVTNEDIVIRRVSRRRG